MEKFHGQVRNGRLVVDEPTDLPDGTELDLVRVDLDAMSESERVEIDLVLLAAVQNVRSGHTIDADDALAELGIDA